MTPGRDALPSVWGAHSRRYKNNIKLQSKARPNKSQWVRVWRINPLLGILTNVDLPDKVSSLLVHTFSKRLSKTENKIRISIKIPKWILLQCEKISSFSSDDYLQKWEIMHTSCIVTMISRIKKSDLCNHIKFHYTGGDFSERNKSESIRILFPWVYQIVDSVSKLSYMTSTWRVQKKC